METNRVRGLSLGENLINDARSLCGCWRGINELPTPMRDNYKPERRVREEKNKYSGKWRSKRRKGFFSLEIHKDQIILLPNWYFYQKKLKNAKNTEEETSHRQVTVSIKVQSNVSACQLHAGKSFSVMHLHFAYTDFGNAYLKDILLSGNSFTLFVLLLCPVNHSFTDTQCATLKRRKPA